MSFASDMAKIAAKLDNRFEELGRAVKIETFSGVIRDTRVDTGRLRGNWQCSEDAPITGTTERLDPTGQHAITDMQSTVQGVSLSYLTNNLEYAPVWEERDAMVARNVQRVKNNIERKARELNK